MTKSDRIYLYATLLWAITASVLLYAPPRAHAQASPVATIDPCATNALKQSVFANITTATTTALVAVVGNTSVYVCDVVATMTGTTAAETFLLEQGTGATCAGAPTPITATFNSGILTSGATVFSTASDGMMAKTAAANGLCVVSTVGTSPTINLHVTYVQQ